jgi:hypothetical protein
MECRSFQFTPCHDELQSSDELHRRSVGSSTTVVSRSVHVRSDGRRGGSGRRPRSAPDGPVTVAQRGFRWLVVVSAFLFLSADQLHVCATRQVPVRPLASYLVFSIVTFFLSQRNVTSRTAQELSFCFFISLLETDVTRWSWRWKVFDLKTQDRNVTTSLKLQIENVGSMIRFSYENKVRWGQIK